VGKLALHKPITRVRVRSASGDTQYATSEYLLESLESLRIKYNLPLRQALEFIVSRRTDSVTLGKENPYLRFHANLIRNVVHISIQESSRDVSFQIPLISLASMQLT
jgi:hypothetical protein